MNKLFLRLMVALLLVLQLGASGFAQSWITEVYPSGKPCYFVDSLDQMVGYFLLDRLVQPKEKGDYILANSTRGTVSRFGNRSSISYAGGDSVSFDFHHYRFYPGCEYHMLIEENAIEDLDGNPYPGLLDTTFWRFCAYEETPPQIIQSYPPHGAMGVDTAIENLVAIFSEPIRKGKGFIHLTETKSGDTLRIGIKAQIVEIHGDSLIIPIPTDFIRPETDYHIQMEPGVVMDTLITGNSWIWKEGTWDFSTKVVQGMNENQPKRFSIYPNPTTGVIHIQQRFASKAPLTYRLANTHGQSVRTGTVSNGELDFSHLLKGIYLLSLFQDGRWETMEVVIH